MPTKEMKYHNKKCSTIKKKNRKNGKPVRGQTLQSKMVSVFHIKCKWSNNSN